MRQFWFTILFLTPLVTGPQSIPVRAKEYLPILLSESENIWPNSNFDHYFAGQVEQETCPTIKSYKCWNPRTELKTSREYGFGLGQLTITSRFNNFKEVTTKYSSLKSWKYEDRYNPRMQLRAMLLMDRTNYNAISSPYNTERLAMSFAAYNGGLGGLLKERQLCTHQKSCDYNKWFGNVEKYSNKSRKKANEYSKSFFEINRGYVYNIMKVRSSKYATYITEQDK